MIRDPFYRQILDELNRPLDGDLFERCACDLLREAYPSLAPVRGGNDAGMDGAISSEDGDRLPLVCTTQENVKANLQKSLRSYLRAGGAARRVVSATSRALSPSRQRGLEQAAQDLEFKLIHIHEQADLADRLYRNPHWCKELLGLTGYPPALSALPESTRPMLLKSLLGRDRELNLLRAVDGDCLLVGQPGSGKTFLAQQYARSNEGLFVVHWDHERIANGIRSERPKILVVDDAHLDFQRIIRLRQLRSDMRAGFRIAAITWPGSEDGVQQALQAPDSSRIELELLPIDTMAKLIDAGFGAYGLKPNNALVREIVEQAVGRPGLALTLVHICVQDGADKVLQGEALARDVLLGIENLIGQSMTFRLAIFSLAGSRGIAPDQVAKTLREPLQTLWTDLAHLAAAGVIAESNQHIAVIPAQLRFALVREAFYSQVRCISIESVLRDMAVSPLDALLTLGGAKTRGADVDDKVLRSLAESAGSAEAWRAYAALGRREVEYILSVHPTMLPEVARAALTYTPDIAIPLLLSSAVSDDRGVDDLHRHSEHPLRILREWVESGKPGSPAAIRRRNALMRIASSWTGDLQSSAVRVHAAAYAMSPSYDSSEAGPGSASIIMTRGIVTAEDCEKIQALWPTVLSLLSDYPVAQWIPILRVVEDWAFPSRHTPSDSISWAGRMREFAQQMVADVVSLQNESQSLQRWAKNLCTWAQLELEIHVDRDFLTLYPINRHRENWRTARERDERNARALAAKLVAKGPEDATERLAYLVRESEQLGIPSPSYDFYVCSQIASQCESPLKWLHVFELRHVPPRLCSALLHEAASRPELGHEEIMACWLKLEDTHCQSAALELYLQRLELPCQTLREVMTTAAKFPAWVEILTVQGRVADTHLEQLLAHDDAGLAMRVALGLWRRDAKHWIPQGLRSAWDKVILNARPDDDSGCYDMGEILSSDTGLCVRWVRSYARNRSDVADYRFNLRRLACEIAGALPEEERQSILREVTAETADGGFVSALVGADATLYGTLLKRDELRRLQCAPLAAWDDDGITSVKGYSPPPSDQWLKLASMALAAGISSEDVADAGLWVSSMSGSGLDIWIQRLSAFEVMQGLENDQLQQVGILGAAMAEKMIGKARKDERERAVYGL